MRLLNKPVSPRTIGIAATVVTVLVALGAGTFLGEPWYWNLLLGLGFVTLGIMFGVRPSAAASLPIPPGSRACNA